MRVLAYVRVSTEEQAEEGFSLPAQRQRIADFCRSQWPQQPALRFYADEGCSARDTARPRLAALRREAAAGDTVLVLRLDRLTRSVLDLYTLLKEWEERGVQFRSVTEPYDTGKPEGRFMLGLLALLAEWERLRIGERVREVMAHTVRTDRRHLSRPPLGYRLVGGALQLCEAEAALVQEIYARALAGQSARAIAAALTQEGRRTRQGARFSDVAVAYVLRNPVYTGKVSWQRPRARRSRKVGTAGILVAAAHSPLVSQADWEAVQAQTARRMRQGRQPRYALSGLAQCAECGGRLRGVTQRRYRGGRPVTGAERAYYRCAGRESGGGCSLPYLRAEQLEARVLQALSSLIPPARLEAASRRLTGSPLQPHGDRPQHLQAELRRLERACRRWDEAYQAGAIDLQAWGEKVSPLRGEADRVRRQLTAAPASGQTDQSRPPADSLSSLWLNLTPGGRRSLLQALLNEILVGKDGTVRLHPREPEPV